MSLLDKFAAVQIDTDSRISPEDVAFCRNVKAMYDNAAAFYKEQITLYDKYKTVEYDIKGDTEEYKYLGFISTNFADFEATKQLVSNQKTFIETIVRHFRSKYDVTLSDSLAKDRLLPKKPDYYERDEETLLAYNKSMCDLVLTYEQVVDEVISQLGGLSFAERAVKELKRKCYTAAHNYKGEANYIIKNNTMTFSSLCCYNSWYSYPDWSISDGDKNILWGIVRFETGQHNSCPWQMKILFGYRINEALYELDGFEKVLSIKLFKNGRVDIKFATPALAQQFAEEYLTEQPKVEYYDD